MQDIVILRHQTFGYFTGAGWSSERDHARKMSLEGAESWLRTFREFTVGHFVDWASYLVEPE